MLVRDGSGSLVWRSRAARQVFGDDDDGAGAHAGPDGLVRVAGADGRERVFRVARTPLPTGPGAGADLVAEWCTDVTAAVEAEERLLRLSATVDASRLRGELARPEESDPLTGLPGRPALLARADEATADAAAPGLLLTRLRRLHHVVAASGARAADEVLVATARRLCGAVPRGAVVARLEAGVFGVLVPPATAGARSLMDLAGRLQEVVAEPTSTSCGREVSLGCDVGVAVGGEIESGVDLLGAASSALALAAESRGPRVVLHDPVRRAQVEARQRLAADLRSALVRPGSAGRLELYFQPVVELVPGGARTVGRGPGSPRVAAVEALVRWRHPRLGLLEPDAFLPLATEEELDTQLTDVVLELAAATLARWSTGPLASVTLSVNLSAADLSRPDLSARVRDACHRAGAPLDRLGVEITETAVVTDLQEGRTQLRHLRALGVATAVDDFGTGWSSLAYLRRFPLDVLKVDRSFVAACAEDATDAVLVEHVVGLAQRLGLSVVAEGVETLEQAEQVRRFGCRYAQGYLFSRPVTEAELLATQSATALLAG